MKQSEILTKLNEVFPATFLENLLLDEDRETFNAMTPEQKKVVRKALMFGMCIAE